jgi:hypothetical protein
LSREIGKQSGSSDAAGRRLRRSVGVWRRCECPRSEFRMDPNFWKDRTRYKCVSPGFGNK